MIKKTILVFVVGIAGVAFWVFLINSLAFKLYGSKSCPGYIIGQTTACDFVEQGDAKRKGKQYRDAIKDYDEAIRLNPNLHLAYFSRGFAKHSIGMYEEAVRDYDEAIRGLDQVTQEARAYHGLGADKVVRFVNRNLAGVYADLYLFRGHANLKNGLFEEAAKDYDEAVRKDPGNADAINARGYAKHKLGRDEEAIKDYDEVLRQHPDFSTGFRNRADAKHKLKMHEEALKDYDEAIRLDPDEALGYSARGKAKIELGQIEEAIEDYEEALRLDPDDDEIKEELEKARKMQG